MNQKYKSLQIYRGLALALVVVHHITASSDYYLNYKLFNNFFGIGWSGVDFFFVLSGFIITSTHFNDIGDKSKLPLYLLKRFTRICPTYWIVASVALGVLLIIGKNKILDETISISYIIKSYLLIPGIYPFFGVAWSLSYEVFFYLFFAILIWRGFKFLIFSIPIYLIILFIVFEKQISNLFVDFLSSGYHIEFLLGCLVAIFAKKVNYEYNSFLMLLGIIMFIGSYISCYLNYFDKVSFESRILFGISSSIIIMESIKLKREFNSKWLYLLGDASFSLYLTHTLIIPIFFKIISSKRLNFHVVPTNIYIMSFICLSVCIITSLLYFEYVEKPLTNNIFSKMKSKLINPI